MLVRTFPTLEFGIILSGFLRKMSPIQALSITLDFEPTREHASLQPGDILKVIIPSHDRERGYADLEFSNLIVGSDFTKSNEWTSWRKEQSFCVTRFV